MRSLTIVLLIYLSSASSNILTGVNLRLSACDNYPWDRLERQTDGNFTFTGSSAEVIDWLAAKLNFTYTIVPAFKEDASRLNISDLFLSAKYVVEKRADGTAIQYIVDPDRAAKLDYTFFVTTELFTLIVPKPQPVSRLFAFIRPFQPIVWFLIGLVTLLFIGMMCWFSWIYKHKIASDQNQSSNQSRNGLEELTDNIGIYIKYSQHSFRILAAGWLLATLVLVNSYSSIVVSSLTVPLKNPPINSFEDLAVSKEVALILRQDFVITKQILGATSGVYKVLGDSIRANPDRLFNDFPSLLKKLEDGRHAFGFITSFTRYFVWNQYKKNGKCVSLLTDPLPLSNGYFCMLMQKGSTYIPAMNYGLIRLFETGLNLYWIDKQTPKAEQCTVVNEKKSQSIGNQTKIKLKDLTGAFFILSAGLSAAFLCFLIELLIYRIRNRIRKLDNIKRKSAVVSTVNQPNEDDDKKRSQDN